MAVVRTVSSSAPPARLPEARCRAGYSLVELMAAVSIFAIVTALLYGALSAQVRLARVSAQRVAAADVIRTASHILAGEARRMSGADVRAAGADSIALRSFRGMAVVCDGSYGDFIVRYRGDRMPDAGKDSVLVIAGSEPPYAANVAEVGAAAPGACAPQPGETVMRWAVPEAAGGAAIMLVFESGAYFMSSRALRYRRGAEGRQPLTAELLIQPPSRLGADGGALTATLAAGRSPAVRLAAPFASRNEP